MKHKISWIQALAVSVLFLVLCRVSAFAAASWEPLGQIETAARQEGKLVIYAGQGQVSLDAKHAISKVMSERYGINVDWTTTTSATDIVQRVLAEQRTRQYVVDLAMTGFGTAYWGLKPKGYLLPILAPSTLQKNVWRLDPARLTPNDREWLYINMPLTPSLFLNTKVVRPEDEPKSYKDLLNPKWKGKIVLQTPARPGSGSGWFRPTFRTLGEEYMRALANMVILVAQTNEVPDSVIRGQYAIGIAPSVTRARELIQQGAPVKFVNLKEGAHLATNGIYFITNTPHLNAAKLFLQWFFTKEGQTLYNEKNMSISVRKDVGQEYLPPGERYSEDQPFMAETVEDTTGEKTRELYDLARQIFEEKR